MKVISNIFCLFMIQELILTKAIGEVTISTKHIVDKKIFECKITDEILSVVCRIAIEVSYHPTDEEPFGGCHKEGKNVLSVVLSKITSLKYFECNSSNPFAIDFDFGSEKPLPQFTKFKTERICPDFSNSSSYTFTIKMIVPKLQIFDHDKAFYRFTYTIFNLNQQTEIQNTKIRFVVIISQDDNTEPLKATTIKVTDGIVYLPCDNFLSRPSLYFFEGIRTDGTCPDSPSKLNLSNNSSVQQWNLSEGFRVNISKLGNKSGTFLCVEDGENDPSQWLPWISCLPFGIQFPPSLQYFPEPNFIFYKSQACLSKSNIRLMCSSTEANVTMTSTINEELNVTLRHYEVEDPEHRFITEMEIPHFQLKNKTFVNEVNCVNDSTSMNILRKWIVTGIPLHHIIYVPSIDRIVCGSILDRSQLLQKECDDIYQCRMWENYLQNKNGVELCNDQLTPLITGTDCEDQSAFIEQTKKFGGFEFCKSLLPVKRAVVQCLTKSVEGILVVKELYFRGFDGMMYSQSDVKTEAIIELKCINEESYFIFGQNSTCSCEGHSFFHAHGIHWFVVFTNGSTQTFPKDIIVYKKRPLNRDAYNPLSVVDIWFKFRDMRSVLCSVPVLNTKEWHNATKQIQFRNGMAPTILSIESEKTFSVGEQEQSLVCVSQGRPTPNVEWSRKNGPIEAPLRVFGQQNSKQLIFPDYNETLEGTYVCTASNTFGNTTKYFEVSTKKDLVFGIGSVLILTVIICVLITLSLTVYFIRRLRASQRLIAHLTEAEMDEFFHGKGNQQSLQLNPVALPYDTEYEMAKNSFEIDREQILGSGEFGTVYKGKISNSSGEFAFKTTRNISSPDVLKGMLSELKIMIYVGKHENVIMLVGAYTQEIQSGVLYIATELCALGSLHSHLRNMKHDISENFDFHKSGLYAKCLRWSEEIANGMDYLSFKQVIHSDLAARNILLTEREIVKISDFGLSRRMYNYVDYKKTDKSNPLPWKWMAIESLREMTFSTQSDVWAYGVTIWEIFSLGDVPYPGISWTIEFLKMLDQGLRNLKPDYATNELYDIMLSCWHKNPTERPDFSALRYFFMDYKIETFNDETSSSSNREEFYMDLNP